MKQLFAYKYRIYPTDHQMTLLAKIFGCKRVIYNHYLSEQQTRFKNKEKHLSNYDINKDITKLKKKKDCAKAEKTNSTAQFPNFFKRTEIRNDI